jgi:hypothetical protein
LKKHPYPYTRIFDRFFVLLVILLVGCQPTPQTSNDGFGANNSALNWDRSPTTIIFRADIIGGNREQEFFARNEVPLCTVYGDGRVVWTNEVASSNQEVLFDQLSDDVIRTFIDTLTITEQFFSYPGQADLQLPSAVAPVYEVMEVNVSGQSFKTDAFSGWPADYFPRILDRCRTLSQTPILFEATAGWLSVVPVPADLEAPTYQWEPNAAGISLAEIAASNERRWITGSNPRVLFNLLQTTPSNARMLENGSYYQIAVEVPGVTRYSPPAQQ